MAETKGFKKIMEKKLLKDTVNRIEYIDAYSNLSSSYNVTMFLEILVDMIEAKKQKPHPEDLVCTLLGLICNAPWEYKGLKGRMVQWEENRDKHKKKELALLSFRVLSHVNQIIDGFEKRDSYAQLNQVIGYLCYNYALTKTAIVQEEVPGGGETSIARKKDTFLDKLKKIGNQDAIAKSHAENVLIKHHLEPRCDVEFSYVYGFIDTFMKAKNRVIDRQIVNSLGENVKNLMSMMKTITPDTAIKSGLAIIHVARQLATFNTFENAEVLKLLIWNIDILRRLPSPLGGAAQELLQMLYSDVKSPGNTMRFKFRADIPALDCFLEDLENMEGNELFAKELLTNPWRCYYVPDNNLETVMILNQRRGDSDIKLWTLEELRIMMIANLLSAQKLPNNFLTQLVSLTPREHFVLYSKLIRISEKTDELSNVTDAASLQKQSYEFLMNEVMKSKISFGKMDRIDKDKLLSQLNLYPGQAIPYPYADLQNICNYMFDASSGRGRSKLLSAKSVDNTDAISTEDQKKDQVRIALTKIFQKVRDLNLPLHQPPTKIVLFGGDEEVHKFVQDIGSIWASNYKLLVNLDWRIFVVPTKPENKLARYIATYDSWYARHMYGPFVLQPLLPKVETVQDFAEYERAPSESKIHTKTEKNIFYEMKENLIQKYISEAIRTFPVKIGEIECYSDFPSEGPPNLRVYFYSHVEMGINIWLHEENEKNDIFFDTMRMDTLSMSDQLNNPLYPNMELCMTTHSISLDDRIGRREEVTKSIFSLTVSNMPTEFTRTALPFPNSEWFEVAYLDQESSKLMMQTLRNKKMMNNYPEEEFIPAFDALFSTIHTTAITIRSGNPSNNFKFMADGKKYGPYKKLVIKPVQVKTSLGTQPLTLPVMTFFPIST